MMKRKGIFRILTCLLAVVLSATAFSMTAFASELDGESESTVDSENALTPDGNMTLIDDIATDDGGKQFLTVQTKNGNIFYIIIDRDDDGELTVHFLNQVDEDDLFALIEDKNTETETPTCVCTDKCSIGAINTVCPVCLIQMSQCQGTEPTPTVPTEPTDPEPTVEPTEENSGIGGMIAIVIIIVAGLGGAAFYFFVVRSKQKKTVKILSVLDDFDLEDEEEYLNEDTEESE